MDCVPNGMGICLAPPLRAELSEMQNEIIYIFGLLG